MRAQMNEMKMRQILLKSSTNGQIIKSTPMVNVMQWEAKYNT